MLQCKALFFSALLLQKWELCGRILAPSRAAGSPERDQRSWAPLTCTTAGGTGWAPGAALRAPIQTLGMAARSLLWGLLWGRVWMENTLRVNKCNLLGFLLRLLRWCLGCAGLG